MNLKILVALALATATLAPSLAEAQRGRSNRDWGHRQWQNGWRNRDNSGWRYGYPQDYRWPYGRSYNLGTGRLWTPRGAHVYRLPNGVTVYLPR